MKTMIVAAAAAFMMAGTVSAAVSAKPVAVKEAKAADTIFAHYKPGSNRGGSGGATPCSPFGCKSLGRGWG